MTLQPTTPASSTTGVVTTADASEPRSLTIIYGTLGVLIAVIGVFVVLLQLRQTRLRRRRRKIAEVTDLLRGML